MAETKKSKETDKLKALIVLGIMDQQEIQKIFSMSKIEVNEYMHKKYKDRILNFIEELFKDIEEFFIKNKK